MTQSREQHLREWYFELLEAAQHRGIVEKVLYMADDFFPSISSQGSSFAGHAAVKDVTWQGFLPSGIRDLNHARALGFGPHAVGREEGADRTLMDMPYCEGDFWVGEVPRILSELGLKESSPSTSPTRGEGTLDNRGGVDASSAGGHGSSTSYFVNGGSGSCFRAGKVAIGVNGKPLPPDPLRDRIAQLVRMRPTIEPHLPPSFVFSISGCFLWIARKRKRPFLKRYWPLLSLLFPKLLPCS